MRARPTLNIAREIDPRRKENRAYSSVSSARGTKMSPSDASYCLKKKEKKRNERLCTHTSVHEEAERERGRERGGGGTKKSDGLEEIEGRISSKAAANTEILFPFPRPGIVLVYTILAKAMSFTRQRLRNRSRRR